MEGRKREELKNEILAFMDMNFRSNFWTYDELHGNYAYRVTSDRHFIDILKEMNIEDSRYFDSNWEVEPNAIFYSTEYSKQFLDKGGYVGIYDTKLEAESKRKKFELQEARIQKLTEDNLNQKIKTHWLPIIFSVIGLAIAIASFFRPNKAETNRDVLKRIEQLETNQKQFEKVNDSLKNELYKAELAIRSYEEN